MSSGSSTTFELVVVVVDLRVRGRCLDAISMVGLGGVYIPVPWGGRVVTVEAGR